MDKSSKDALAMLGMKHDHILHGSFGFGAREIENGFHTSI
jgi:hypothetical protein